MTETLTIDCISATAPDDAHGLASRVERIVRRVADHRLERLLGSYSLAPEGVWCISRVELAAALDFERPDSALEDALARAVLDAITSAIQEPETAHYQNPVQALAGLVATASLHRFDAAWVWLRMGFIGDVDQLERQPGPCVLDALLGHSDHAVAALVQALQVVDLPRVHRLLGESGWVRLASSILGAYVDAATQAMFATVVSGWQVGPEAGPGGSVTDVGTSRLGGASDEQALVSQAGSADDIARASRIVTVSQLAVAARKCRLRWRGPTALALGVLAVAESEPAMLRRDAAISLCLAVARALSGATPIVSETYATTTQSHSGARNLMPSACHGSADENATKPSVVASGVDSDEPLGDRTEYAGLLFLLNLAVDAAMPDALLNDRSLDGIAPAVLLARTAMALAPIEPDDPVVFAFAGVDPHRVLHRWNRPLPEPVMERIGVHASKWAAAAARLLGRQDEDSLSVMTEISARRGRIAREPGWMDVHLNLDDVDVDVRRAGLDLDPGWVPWLGSVVRFRYA
jgi:hypothetical protein